MEARDPAGFCPPSTPSQILGRHRATVLDLLAAAGELSDQSIAGRGRVAGELLSELERQARVDEEVLEVALGDAVATPAERAQLQLAVLQCLDAPREEQSRRLVDVADLLDGTVQRVERLERRMPIAASQVARAMTLRQQELQPAAAGTTATVPLHALAPAAAC